MAKASTSLSMANWAMQQIPSECSDSQVTWLNQKEGALGLYRVKVVYEWNPARITIDLGIWHGKPDVPPEKFTLFVNIDGSEGKLAGSITEVINGTSKYQKLTPLELQFSIVLIEKAEKVRCPKRKLSFWDRFFGFWNNFALHHDNA